jgi:hypothetical protein
MHKRVTIVEVCEWRRLYESESEDYSIATIARRFGRAPSVVHRHLTAAGVRMRPPGDPNPLSHDTMRETIALYEAGESCSAIGRRYGLTERAIRWRLDMAGVPRRRVGGPAPRQAAERPVGTLPIAELVPHVEAFLTANARERDNGDIDEAPVLERLGLTTRRWWAWRNGEQTAARFSSIDMVLLGLGLHPWDVWSPDSDTYALAMEMWGFDPLPAVA